MTAHRACRLVCRLGMGGLMISGITSCKEEGEDSSGRLDTHNGWLVVGL